MSTEKFLVLTAIRRFLFLGKSFFFRLQNKREEGSPDRRLRFALISSHPAAELRGCYWSEKVERLFVKSSECYERIESFASQPHFITLLKCECILYGSTVKHRYNEVLRMTNDFLYPRYSKIDEKAPRHNENSL